MKGDFDHAHAQFEKLLDQGENWQTIGEEWLVMFYLYQGKFNQAIMHIERGIPINQRLGNKSGEAWMHIKLAEIFSKQGDPDASFNAVRRAFQVWRTSWTMMKLGSEYARLNKFNEAQELLEQLRILKTKEQTQNNLANFYRLKGVIDFYKQDYKNAMHNLEMSKSLDDDFETRVLLAKISNRNGRYDKAKEEYEYILAHQYATLFDALPTMWPLAHYWLAKIHELNGNQETATIYYQKFLNLWKDADRDLPELIDAKNQIIVTRSISQ